MGVRIPHHRVRNSKVRCFGAYRFWHRRPGCPMAPPEVEPPYFSEILPICLGFLSQNHLGFSVVTLLTIPMIRTYAPEYIFEFIFTNPINLCRFKFPIFKKIRYLPILLSVRGSFVDINKVHVSGPKSQCFCWTHKHLHSNFIHIPDNSKQIIEIVDHLR